MTAEVVKAEELRLGDVVVSFEHGPYGHATVKRIYEDLGEVELLRVYVHSGDFSYTGGVICTIGYEEYRVPFGKRMTVVARKKPEVR
jgi:hypothetical protein